MKKELVFFLALITSLTYPGGLTAGNGHPESVGTLEITFHNIRNDKGQVAIGINRSAEGWPRRPHMEPNWKKSGLQEGTMTVMLDLPYGTYAISVLDDENSNREMDMVLGFPREGFGFSGNPKVGMKAPSFEECSFVFNRSMQKISINIVYMGKK